MRRIATWLVIVTLCWAAPVAAAPLPAAPALAPARVAGGTPLGAVVGTGTPETCTSAALFQAVSDLQNLGGGPVSFNCGAAPHTIVVTATLVITADIAFDGGNLGDVTLSGDDSRQIFRVQPGAYLALTDMVLTAGYIYDGTGGCVSASAALVVLLRTLVYACHTGTFAGAALSGDPAPITEGTISQGGAIGNSGGTLTIIDSQVLSSTADSGGGIYSTGSLNLSGSRVAGNAAGSGGGLVLAGTAHIDTSLIEHNQAGNGGGLATFITANLLIDSTRFYSNTAVADGGGLYSQYALTMTHSTLDQNSAGSQGGGLYVYTGTVTLAQLTATGNQAQVGGGLLLLGGVMHLTQGLIDGNQAATGGGVANLGAQATLVNVTISRNWVASDSGGYYDSGPIGFSVLTNVTVSGNTAVSTAGGIKSVKPLTMTNVTIANNQAFSGAGFYRTNNTFAYAWRNVLLAYNLGNAGSENCNASTATTVLNSLSSDGTCGLGAGLNANLPLGPLAINGGDGSFLMPTHLLLAGSAAINGGTNTGIPLTDQRGAPRPAGGVADVGAVESDALTPWLWLPAISN